METGIRKPLDFAAINAACFARLPALLNCWLSDGKRRGREWIALNPTRQDRRAGSFSINMDTGRWSDFATGDAGGDPISLFAYLMGYSQYRAAQELHDNWGAGT